MIHVFCKQKGSGKTKALIDLANSKVKDSKGSLVYINDSNRVLLEIHKNIRFICAQDFNIYNYKDFYGFLCGIISKDYDVDNIFIDGILNDLWREKEALELVLSKVEYLSEKFNIDFYINIGCEENNIPNCIRKYIA